ncbi:hypothetical protein DP113_30195 [Brasilonema octagenarum UFV-E1]|uniref:Uncharacterized protein n=2 Tax=Brasilonema TaxID=383614 RepID=A0A856MR69_9CYAN|nr:MULTISPECIES: hypothetical protein [Brasilonema]NMF65778.1 hypothetical protein [Brasilonema octagenarum UFV-OR1]QDL11576.1 hypothetical protein DP114_30040 [Brasilonema sennae CENA114]QDL17954.1 hypothetical protein DP113_30195 [Brasilonema octagenarum UFV-E1]
MSQDNQNSQPPFSPEPEANQPQPRVESASQPPQKRYQRVQPIWKAITLRILRGTIGVLETTVDKLETQPSIRDKRTPGFFQKLQLAWSAVLGKIRSILPENLSTKLSDTAITGIIAGIAVILVWTTSTVFGGKPTEVASVPPEVETPPSATITTAPEVETLPTPPAIEETPPPVEEITPPPTAETPPPSIAEETPPPEPELEPTPTPTIILTPEQTLIAAIENQIAEVSDRFASGLIQSIKANFRTSSLAITIHDEWYNIEQSQQNKLLAQMLERSNELDFIHLDILDSRGKLVARNPVVGTEMIVFQRRISLIPQR